jgi:hypothetical protein
VGGYSLSQLNGISSDPDSTHVFTMATFNQLLTALQSIATETCNTPVVPYLAPTLLQPAVNGRTNDSTPTLSWQPVPYAGTRYGGYYEIMIDDNNTFTSPEVTGTSTTVTFTSGTALPTTSPADKIYYWRVRAHNELGAGPWSAARPFALDITPPGAPTLVAPANSAALTAARPTFSWTAVSSGGTTTYQILVDNDPVFGSPRLNSTVATTSIVAPLPLHQGANYWMVRAIDQAGNVGPYTSARGFTVNSQSAPADNFFLISTTAGVPTFSWSSLAGAVDVRVQVSTSSTFSTLFRDVAVLPTLTSVAFSGGNALPWGVYYWRLAVNLGSGLEPSPFSRKLTVTPPAPPVPVQLTASGLFTQDTTPTLAWNAVPYPYAGVDITYTVQLDNTSTFASPEFTGDTAATSITPGSGLPDGLYYWRVRAFNEFGLLSAYSAPRTLTIDNVAPAAPVPVAPASGAITTVRPAYSWSAVSSGGTTTYELEVDDNSGFSSPDVDVTVTTTSSLPAISLRQGTNYWRVRAIDAAGNIGPWSVLRSWTVNSQTAPVDNFQLVTTTTGAPVFTWTALPGATELRVQVSTTNTFGTLLRDVSVLPTATTLTLSGANALPFGVYYWRLAVNPGTGLVASPLSRRLVVTPPLPAAPVLGTPNTGAFLNTGTPTLNWTAVPYPYAGVTLSYQYELATSAAFGATVIRTGTVSGTSVSISPALVTNGVYYWRVRAQNSFGAYGAFAAARSFTFDSVVPPNPNVVAPGSVVSVPVVTTIRPTYSWTAVVGGGTMSYRVQVDNNNTFASPEVNQVVVSTSLLSPVSLSAGQYYQRVQAVDGAGNVGGFSAVASFFVNPMVSPVDNFQLVTTTTGAPVFTWTALPGATELRVQVSTTNTFGTLLRDVSVLPTATTLTLSGANALPFGVYYWRLAFNVGSGLIAVPNSAARRLTVTPPLPTAPVLISPLNAATLPTGVPLLAWNSIPYPYVGTTINYEIMVDNNSIFASPERTFNTAAGSVQVLPGLPAGLYYWRVRAVNNFGAAGPWSAVRTMTLLP